MRFVDQEKQSESYVLAMRVTKRGLCASKQRTRRENGISLERLHHCRLAVKVHDLPSVRSDDLFNIKTSENASISAVISTKHS